MFMNHNKIYIPLFAVMISMLSIQADAKMTKEAHALYQQACNYEYKSDYNSAINTIQKAIAINGDDAMLYTKIAGLYSDIGRYEDALGAYKKAIKLRPNDAFIYISIGNILQTMGDYENAYNSFMQAQQIYPEYKYNYLNLANVEYFRKNYKNAIENYNTFLSAYPEHQEANENLANVYYVSNEPEKACEIYSDIYKKYPTAFKDYTNYGMALFDTKQYQAASEILEKALENNPDDEAVLAKLALSYQNMDENDKALATFKKVFEVNPKLAVLKFDYANLLGNMGKNEEAIEQYKEYLTAFPDDADAYRNLGLVYKKIDNNELALFNFEKSYSKDSSNNDTKKELALCYHKKADYVNALKYYDMALKAEPENYELLVNKALTLHAMGNYVSAIEIYKTLLDKQPNERLSQNLMAASIAYGYNLYEKEDYGQAILYFEDAIELNDKEASAYFGYAQANEKLGCNEIALTNYEKAVMLAPGNRDYNIALKECRNKAKQGPSTINNKPLENKEVKNTQTNSSEGPLSYEDLIKKADEYYNKQKYEEAIDYYTKAVVFKPADKVTLLKIANLYRLLGNNTKALSFYDKILSLDSNNTDALFNKGLVLANQKNYDECIACFEKVIKLTPEFPYAYYSIGLAYEQKQDKDKALEYYYLYSGIETDEKMLNTVNQKIKQLEK